MICTVCQAKAKVEIKNFSTSIEHKRCFKKNLFCNGCAHKAVIHKTLGRINGSPIELVKLDYANESGHDVGCPLELVTFDTANESGHDETSSILNLSKSEVVPSALNQESISSGWSRNNSSRSIRDKRRSGDYLVITNTDTQIFESTTYAPVTRRHSIRSSRPTLNSIKENCTNFTNFTNRNG